MPADARALIVNCGDFGMYEAVNLAVIDAIERGIANSCSLMPPCPAAAHAMAMLRQRPNIPFGIHLTVICDLPHRWRPLSQPHRAPSLLDDSGELFTPDQAPDFLARARLDDVEREFRAQIRAVTDTGLTPTHLDWHCLADGGRDDIFALTLALADEHGFAVRASTEPHRRTLRQRGLPAVDHPFLDSFRLDLHDKPARFADMLRDLPIGLSEWGVHPGSDDHEARVTDPDGWPVRHTDHQFLISPHTEALLREQGIAVTDYRAVQRAWGSRNGARTDVGANRRRCTSTEP